jgi:phytoene synthase
VRVSEVHYRTFKRGSRTYFNSSLFFPKRVRRDVFILYGFVRVADDFVDSVPADPEGFGRFKERYRSAWAGEASGDLIVDSFVELARRKGFEAAWTEAFLHSMELDLGKKEYDRLEETLEYIYGSAEVIGLYMSRILELREEAFPHAQMLGRAMQYINFIRDIKEDLGLGRRYLPLAGTGLERLTEEHARSHSEQFRAFLEHHLALYRGWQAQAVEGYRYLPRRYRIPIRTAGDMYDWTGRRIERRPLLVFERKVKPGRLRILAQIVRNALTG